MTLDTYIPEVRHPLIGGKNVTVAPLKIKQLPAFTRAIGPAAHALFSGDMLGAVAAHGEAIITAVAVATGEDEAWLGDLDADEFLLLAGDVLEVNADFFAHRVTPTLNATVDRLMKKSLTVGANPSPSSSPAESAGETATS